MRSQVIEIKKIECTTIVHNNLTGAKEPGPACSIESFFYRLLEGFARIFLCKIYASL
ncbi:conserved hypothetical protein [Leptospira interrogans serovar Manilae]|uniref:Uncharacterized protein n=1 Tax=Leptospira interrogans serovar Manilae TaxID=214675 RepID=A0AAQ1NYB0_LEPIR|nr:conserved hypothetical protein [Leptospira interrogans serovar Manilae]